MDEGALRDFLIDAGMLSRAQLDLALEQAKGRELGRVLVEQGLLSEDEMRRASAHALGVPYVTLTPDELEYNALELVPEPLARTRGMVAYRIRDNTVEVALLNINDLEALEYLRTTFDVRPRLTSSESMKRALLWYQRHLKQKFGDTLSRNVQAIVEPAPGASSELLRYSAERLPVVHATDTLLRHAIQSRATHVHLIPREDGLSVRYRIAGSMHDAMMLPRHAASPILLRLKFLSGMALKQQEPQEGRFKITIEDVPTQMRESHTLRTSTIPTACGEKMVLRIARELSGAYTLESLGFHGEALERVHQAFLKRRGLIVVAGPERAGKTTTLYTMLDLLHSPHLALATVEENIESRLPYASQTKIDLTLGLTAPVALRAALRLDPDVVMVGEVHDKETASLLQSASSRGVLVLAGTEQPDLLKEGDMVITLRCLKRLCPHHTHEKTKLSRIELSMLEKGGADFTRVFAALKEERIVDKEKQWKDMRFPLPESCKRCEGGYQGVIGLQAVEEERERSLTLIEDGIFKAVQGLTTIEEVLRLTAE